MPAIATRHCDLPEIVRPGHTGWLCEEGDVKGLAAALCEASDRRDLVARYGVAARALVEERYDADRISLDAVYDQVLGRS